MQPQPSNSKESVNNDKHASNGETRTKNIATELGRHRGAVKALESNTEHFDLEAVDSSESNSSSDGELSRHPNFRKTLVRIRTSPVRPAPKQKPSYVELSDEDMQVSGDEDWDVVPAHKTSKSKGKARAISKRKHSPESVVHGHGQKANVRAGSSLRRVS